MPFISCPTSLRNTHEKKIKINSQVHSSFNMYSHIGHEFCVTTGKVFLAGEVGFLFFLKMANALKQRNLYGHQIFIDPTNFCCKSNNIDTLHFRKLI